ncbi:MAG: cytochrome b/b6 domain-containing protein [Burkholderiales bacterium]
MARSRLDTLPGSTPVWDLPVRLFHWALVVLVLSQAVTALIGGNAMEYHALGGYAILTLVIFRILWGFAGGTHARFGDFVRGPVRVMRYARSLFGEAHEGHLGHNPLGGWSVLLMLACLLTQTLSGLFADDEVLTQGPLAKHVSDEISSLATRIHDVNALVLLALIGLHVAAVFFYLLAKKDNLIKPMITGQKPVSPPPAHPSGYGNPLLAAILLACAGLGVFFLIRI